MNIKGSGASLMEIGGVKSSGASLFNMHNNINARDTTITPDQLQTTTLMPPA